MAILNPRSPDARALRRQAFYQLEGKHMARLPKLYVQGFEHARDWADAMLVAEIDRLRRARAHLLAADRHVMQIEMNALERVLQAHIRQMQPSAETREEMSRPGAEAA